MCLSSSEGVCYINRRLTLWVATGSYVGYSPIAPGTCGALLGFMVFLLLARMPIALYGLVLAGVILLGVWISGEAEHFLRQKDASPIVIDEIAGMLVTYMAVPVSPIPLICGFICFRLFDIFKPFPRIETLPAGWGVMCDDLLAGLLAQGCIRVIIAIM